MSFFSHVPSSTRSVHSTCVDRSSVDDTVHSTSLLSISRNGANTTAAPNDGQMPLYFVSSPLNVAVNNNNTNTTNNIINTNRKINSYESKGFNNSNSASYSNRYQVGDPRNGKLSLAHSRPSRRGRRARATLYLRTPMLPESDRVNGKRQDANGTTSLPIGQLSPPPPPPSSSAFPLSPSQSPSSLLESNSQSSSSPLVDDSVQEESSSQSTFCVTTVVEWITHTIATLPDKARNGKVREMVVAATVFLFFLLLQLYLVARTERTVAFLLSVRMSLNEQLVMVSASLTEQLLSKAAVLSELSSPLLQTPPSRLEHLREELESLQAARDRSIHTLYNKTGYSGPESDLVFLIEEHVGYENRVRKLAAEEMNWLDTVNEAQQHRLLAHTEEQSVLSSTHSVGGAAGKRTTSSAYNSSKNFTGGVLNGWQGRNGKLVVSKRDEYLQQTLNQALQLQKAKARFSVPDDDWAVTGALPVETVEKPQPSQAAKLEQNTLATATEQEVEVLHSTPSTSLLHTLRSKLILIPVIFVLVYIFLQLTETARSFIKFL